MTDILSNQLSDRALVYDSFVQLISGSNKYRLKSLQSSEPKFIRRLKPRIGDAGEVVFTPLAPTDYTYDQSLILTADEIDTKSTPTNTRTISYYLRQFQLLESVQIAVSQVYVAKGAQSNTHLRLNFTYELEEFALQRVNEEGEIIFSSRGMIIPDTVSFIRSSS